MSEEVNSSMYSVQMNDPNSVLINRSHLSPEDIQQITQLMTAMGRLRDIERKASEASQRFMKLNATDMRALHYLIIAENRGELVTPSDLAKHLDITTASVTKMLDRLERGEHIARHAHLTDRRAITVTITAETRAAAMGTVGRHQASRFAAAATLTPAERDVVIKYLQTTAEDLEGNLHYLDEDPHDE